jgi:uncharacterized protein (TIGR03545 family)
MIRWNYVLPRLVILSALALLLTFGTGPFLRWSLIQSGQAATGAKVEIGSLQFGWLTGTVCLDEIQVADPQNPFENLVEAQEAELVLNVGALLRKEMVVDRAVLHQVQFSQPRSQSGKLETSSQDPATEIEEPQWLAPTQKLAKRQLNDWLDGLSELGIETATQELQTVQVSLELSERWPAEYEALQRRLTRLQTQYEELRQLASQPKNNPLRIVEMVSVARQNIQTSLQEIDDLSTNLQRLKKQIPVDKQRLIDAKKHDEQVIRDWSQTPKITPEEITQSLFGEEQGKQISGAIQYVQWVRSIIPNPDEDFRPERSGGVDVRFRRNALTPAVWIKLAEITGEAPLGNEATALPFSGKIANLSTHPKRLGSPVTVELATAGEHPTLLQAELWRTTTESRDHFTLDIPSQLQSSQSFGHPNSVVFTIPEGESNLNVDLMIVDGVISGSVKLQRNRSPIEVQQVAEKLGGSYIQGMLGQSIDSIENWDLEIKLDGPVRSPQISLSSSLGPQLAEALNGFAGQLARDQAKRLQDRIDTEVQSTLAKADDVMREVDEVRQTLQTINSEVSSIQQNVARYIGNGVLR